MSKKVKSNGKIQEALVAAVGDLGIGLVKLRLAITRDNLKKVNRKSLLYIRDMLCKRFTGIDIGENFGKVRNGDGECVMVLIDEFIRIREKQSPIFRGKKEIDYSILFL